LTRLQTGGQPFAALLIAVAVLLALATQRADQLLGVEGAIIMAADADALLIVGLLPEAAVGTYVLTGDQRHGHAVYRQAGRGTCELAQDGHGSWLVAGAESPSQPFAFASSLLPPSEIPRSDWRVYDAEDAVDVQPEFAVLPTIALQRRIVEQDALIARLRAALAAAGLPEPEPEPTSVTVEFRHEGTLGMSFEGHEGTLKAPVRIAKLSDGGPALADGRLKVGMTIVTILGEDCREDSLKQVLAKIRNATRPLALEFVGSGSEVTTMTNCSEMMMPSMTHGLVALALQPEPQPEPEPEPEPQPTQDDGTITVDFTQSGSLDLNLTPCDDGNGVMILAVPPGGQAATHPELRPGLIFREVGGTSMRGLSYEEVVAAIQAHGGRPLRVVFSEKPWPSLPVEVPHPHPQPETETETESESESEPEPEPEPSPSSPSTSPPLLSDDSTQQMERHAQLVALRAARATASTSPLTAASAAEGVPPSRTTVVTPRLARALSAAAATSSHSKPQLFAVESEQLVTPEPLQQRAAAGAGAERWRCCSPPRQQQQINPRTPMPTPAGGLATPGTIDVAVIEAM
jgi:hypothetical protein